MQLFAERGLTDVTIEQITEAADVGKGTFFNYFECKEHILGVLVEVQFSKLQEALAHAAAGKLTAYELLHDLMQRLAEEPGRSPEMARTVISSFLGSEGVRDMISEVMVKGRDVVAQIVAFGQRRGEIAPDLNTHQTAALLQRLTMGTILFWSLKGGKPLANLIEESFAQFWRSVAAVED